MSDDEGDDDDLWADFDEEGDGTNLAMSDNLLADLVEPSNSTEDSFKLPVSPDVARQAAEREAAAASTDKDGGGYHGPWAMG